MSDNLKSLMFKSNYFTNLQGVEVIKRKNGINYTIRNNRERFFFPDEWCCFYDNLKKRQKITFNVLLNTGARINEARNIKVSDIDLIGQRIVLRVTKRIVNRPGVDKTGKRNMRVISISKIFCKYLREIIRNYDLKNDDFIPILSTPAANIAMKKTLRNIGIKDWNMFSVHNVRKTAETWMISLGADSFKIVKYFGHSSAVALKHYFGSDNFNHEEKNQMRQILGDIFSE